jgi:hypothetical protein
MPKIKLNLRKLSTLEKIAQARQIVTAMTGNANFDTPHPTLATITGVTNTVEQLNADAQAARAAARMKASELTESEATLDRVLAQLASYVESISGGDEAMIASAGMTTRAPRSAPTMPPPPEGLLATAGDHDGQINLQWEKVKGARSYVVQQSADPPTNTSWTNSTTVVKPSATITGLTPGQKYWFRVAAVGPRGQSGWSDPATKMAP